MKNLTLFLSFCLIITSFSFAPGWELKKDENGIQVFTRVKEGSPLKEYKATVTVNATMEEVLTVIKDVPNYVNWQYATTQSEIVQRISDDEFISYTLNDAPWPISDREVLIKAKFNYHNDETISLTMHAITDNDLKQPTKDVVRITQMIAKWLLTPTANGIEVMTQVHADPAGSIPKWLANSYVVDSPFKTLTNLKVLMEQD